MVEKFNFTKAYQRIEEINEWFQEEDIDLNKALANYKEGMDLIGKCKKELEVAKNYFEEIKTVQGDMKMFSTSNIHLDLQRIHAGFAKQDVKAIGKPDISPKIFSIRHIQQFTY